MKLAFTEENIKNYVIKLIEGKESIAKFVREKPILHKTEAWDGEDKKPYVDEYDDFDLDEEEKKEPVGHDEF